MPIILICQSLSYKTTPPAILPLDRLQPSSTIRGSWSPRSSRTTPPWKWFGQSSPPWSCCPSRSHLSHSSTPWISTPTVQVGDPVCVCVCVFVYMCVYVCVYVCVGWGGWVCVCVAGCISWSRQAVPGVLLDVFHDHDKLCLVCCWMYFMITTSCAWCVAGCISWSWQAVPGVLLDVFHDHDKLCLVCCWMYTSPAPHRPTYIALVHPSMLLCLHCSIFYTPSPHFL